MSQNVPAAATEHVSVDNIPTGNVELLIQRHEMPDKLLVSRYWRGMEKPEQLAYVPELTCHNVDIGTEGYFKCSECGASCSVDWECSGWGEPRHCPNCGRKVVDK